MPKKFKQITIIGVGLIGGSIGLAVKQRGLAHRVIGVTRHKNTLRKAIGRGAIDAGTLKVINSVAGSDMIILAVPVDKILSALKEITPYIKKGCIVMDVASVKDMIVHRAERIIRNKGFFVGTHPMAGSEQKGVDKADRNLFKGAPCVLTKTRKTNAKAMRRVFNFWRTLGSKVYILSPGEHDKKISNISHLPHVAAAALSLAARLSSLEFASTGFKDTTRIASGDPGLWASILLANRKNVDNDIKNCLKELERLRKFITRGDKNGLERVLLRAKKKRDRLWSPTA